MNTSENRNSEVSETQNTMFSRGKQAIMAVTLAVSMSVANAQESPKIMKPEEFQFSPEVAAYIKSKGASYEDLLVT